MPALAALVDSGPLYALFDRRDQYHHAAQAVMRDFRGRLYSNLAVVQEVHFLLSFSTFGQQQFLTWMHRGSVELLDVTKEDLQRIHALTAKYADVPMDFADATLVVQAERCEMDRILTIGSDFTVYRLKRSKPFVNLFPLP